MIEIIMGQALHRGRNNVTDKEREERDSVVASPEQRAKYIWDRIHSIEPKPTLWDIVCFCTESLALAAAEFTFLQPYMKRVVSVIYTAHYHTPEPFPSCLSLEQKPKLVIKE